MTQASLSQQQTPTPGSLLVLFQQYAEAPAVGFIGLAQRGGRIYVSTAAVQTPHTWNVNTDALNGRSATALFDLPKLWSSMHADRFSVVAASVFRNGPQLLPSHSRVREGSLLCAPIANNSELHGFLVAWPYTSPQAVDSARHRLNARFEHLVPLANAYRTAQTASFVPRTAVLHGRSGTCVDQDIGPDHPLDDPDIAECVAEASQSMAASETSATATAYGWHVLLHRVGPDFIAIRMSALVPVPVPVTVVLTPHQRRVTKLAAQGHSSAQIAHLLGVSPTTVRSHLKTVFKRLGVQNRTELANLLRPTQF